MNVIRREVLARTGVRHYWDWKSVMAAQKSKDHRWPVEVDETAPHVQKHHGFNYYPRPGQEVDPPYTPSKFFVVQRVAKISGNPRFDKKILEDLGLYGKMTDKVIVKNTPQMNKQLYQIKHLIKIKPLVFPNGEPTPEDIKAGATFLDDYGRMFVRRRLGSTIPTLPLPPAGFQEPPPRTSGELGTPSDELMRTHSRQVWDTGMDKKGCL